MTRLIKSFDPLTLILGLVLSVFGMLFIFDAGYARSLRDGLGPMPREFVAQGLFLFVSAALAIGVSMMKVETLFRWAKPIWWITMLGLIGVMIPGVGYEMGGAHRWYKVGPITVQPAEFAKVAVAVYLAYVLATRSAWPEKIKRQKSFAMWLDNVGLKKAARLMPAFWVAVAVVLITIEPDLGTAAVVAVIAYAMFLVGGVTKKSLIWGTVVALLGVVFMVQMEPYRMERIENHLHRWDAGHVDDTGFQTVQSELGMATGGLLGVGPGAGRVKHIIPAPTTDFVSATIAEEFGFIGWMLVMATLGLLTYRLFVLARGAPTKFGALVCVGVGAWIGSQSVVNVMMANGTLPAIGIPLPFISSGGSSLLALWLALGATQVALKPVEAKKPAQEEGYASDRDRWGNGRTRLSRT